MVLGLGAGWVEREHEMFGYELGDVSTRFARFRRETRSHHAPAAQ
jgi:hypothetical protein